jgi:hypothetical protein
MNETLKQKAVRAMNGDQGAQAELVKLLGLGHTRSGASGFLYRKANGRGCRSFNQAMKSWADK